MTSYIKKSINWVYNNSSEIVSSKWTAVASGTLALRKFIYPFGEWAGKKIFSLSMQIPYMQTPEIVREGSKKLANYTVKPVVEKLQTVEYKIFNRLFNSYSRRPQQSIDPYTQRFLQKCVVSPPVSLIAIGPFVEECIFRLPLLYTSGAPNLILSIASSILFAFSHEESSVRGISTLQPNRIGGLIAMGLSFAFLANRLNFTTAILAHMGYNLSCWLLDG